MAIIYTYPVKGTPLAADLVLISDSADSNKSKNATIASLVTSNAIDVVDTLNSLKGDINITGGTNITVTPSGQNIEISTSASNVDGSGTANTIPKWSDSNTLTDSDIYEFSVNKYIGIGVSNPQEKLEVNGNIKTSGNLQFFKDANSVKISTPSTITTSYELIMPAAVGTASQVLKLPSTIGTSPYQLAWGDAGGGSGSIIATADGGTGVGIASAAIYNILVGNGSTGASSAFVESGGVETAIQLPVGATNRRPAASSSNVGLIRYNSQTTNFEVCKETSVGGGEYSWYTISGLTVISG